MNTILPLGSASVPVPRRTTGRLWAALALLLTVLPFMSQGQTLLSRWSLNSATTTNTPDTPPAGVTAVPSTFTGLVLLAAGGTGTGTTPYGTIKGQSFSTDATGTFPAGLSRRRYEQFQITAAAGTTVRVDSILANAAFLGSGNGRLGIVYSKTGFTTNDSTDVTTATPPGGTAVTAPAAGSGGFTVPVTLTNTGSAQGSSVSTGDQGTAKNSLFAFRLNAATSGVTLSAGQTLTIRFYFGASSAVATKPAELQNVRLKGTITTGGGTICNAPTGVSVGSVTSTSAQVSFTAGSGNTSVDVTYYPTATPASSTTVTGATSPLTLSSLAVGTAYTVNVIGNCGMGNTPSTATATFTTRVANSTRVQEWSMRLSSADSANVRSVGLQASTPTLTGLVVSNNALSGGSTTPDYAVAPYSAAYGQAFAPAANGGSWSGGTLSRTDKYEEFTITANGTYTVRLDSLTFANAVYGSANGKLGISYSTNGFASSFSEVTGGFGPAHAAVTASFTAPVSLQQISGANNTTMPATAAGVLTSANYYHLALNGTTGVTLAAGQTLTVRFYYAVGSGSTGRYVLLRDVIATGQATFTPASCGTPSSLSVGSISSNTAQLSFTPGSGGGVTYTVNYFPTATPASSVTVTPAPTASPVALTSLQPSTAYTVNVTANCSVGSLTSSTASTTFTTPAAVLQRWSLRLIDGDSAAVRNAAVTASARTAKRLVLSDGSTAAVPARSAKFGTAVAPNADGTGFSSTAVPPGPGATPSPKFYEQFTVTAAAGNNVRVDAITYNSAFYNTGSGNLAVSYSLNGFAAGTDSTQILASTTQPNTTTNNNVTVRLPLNGGTGVTLTPGQTVTIRFYFAVGSNSVRYAFLRDVFVEGAALPASPIGDLTVTGTQGISGTYNNIIIASGGAATISGPLTVNNSITVQNLGSLNTNCQTMSGAGSFTLAAGGTLSTCSSSITAASSLTGASTFSGDASYVFNGTVAQTSAGMPATARNLTVNNGGNGLTLTQPLGVTKLVRLQNGGLTSNGNLTLLSVRGSGTALVDNTGGTVAGTATMQRAVDILTPDNIGYHHYSSPVLSTTINDLQTPGFDFVLNPAYNTAVLATQVRPFPTVFGYDERRMAPANGLTGTAASSPATDLSSFDKGFFSPTSGDAMPVGRGYTASVPNALTVDFTGTLNNGPVNISGLTRNSAAVDAGYHLLGNPYPSPINASGFAAVATNLNTAVYVFHATSRYSGNYSTYLSTLPVAAGNSTARSGDTPSSLIPAGVGFFMQVTAPNSSNGALALTNTNRTTTFGTQPAFGRQTNTRASLALQVNGAGGTDVVTIYADAAATTGVDATYDAVKMTNPSGLNLAALAGNTRLVINALPAITAATVVPLTLAVPTAGTYTLALSQLANISNTVYLRDAFTGTERLLTAGTPVSVTLTSAPTTRFSLAFRPSGALATTANVLAAQTNVYPNPAHGSFSLLVPAVPGAAKATATLLNALGQVVNTRTLALTAGGATTEYATSGLAAGVYALRVAAGNQVATIRVVVE